ncbi:hypothetical protein ASF44_27055 [Pseudorhodoferax sp. Leaf274]|nr:hypothetical protein ASF44_27055 [Pseudorhodoferax sp. Leaf274]
MGRSHDAMTAAIRSELRQALHLQAYRRGEADLGKLAVGEAGDDSERQNLEVWIFSRCCSRCSHDRRAPACVDGDHANAELPGGAHRAGDRNGDLVELEVKKHAFPALNEFANNSRPGFREQLKTDLV